MSACGDSVGRWVIPVKHKVVRLRRDVDRHRVGAIAKHHELCESQSLFNAHVERLWCDLKPEVPCSTARHSVVPAVGACSRVVVRVRSSGSNSVSHMRWVRVYVWSCG
jgi:hypothetical protein